MKIKKNNAPAISILTSAIIWGLVIVGCSFSLKGTACFDSIRGILAAGAGSHLIIIMPLLINRLKAK